MDENAEAAPGQVMPDREHFHSFENNNNHNEGEEEKKAEPIFDNDLSQEQL